MGTKCGNMTTDLGIYRDAVSTANALIIMEKGNLIEKQQICLDANSAASRSKFLHFKSVLTILALCLCMVMGGEAWGQTTLLSENFDNMSRISTSYSANGWFAYNAGSGNNWQLNTDDTYSCSGSNSAEYVFNSDYAANCYLVSAPFTVSANMTQLNVSLYENVDPSYAETFDVFFVKAGDFSTAAGVVSATHYSAIASASYTNEYCEQVTGSNVNSALAGQSVRVVIHCTSARDRDYLEIDDITVTETTSGGGGGSPHTVTWSIDGSTSIVSTSTLTNGQVPSDPTISCGGKVFVGWTTSPISGSQNSAPSPLYSRSDLVGASVAADVTYYAVFANVSSGAPVNTTLWSETWTGGTADEKPSEYGFEGTTVYGGATLTYAQSNNNTKLYNDSNAGGTAPELLLSKNNNTWTISNIPTGGATQMTMTFLSNRNNFALTSTTQGITITGSNKSWTITATSGVSNFNLTLKNTGNNNARIDDIELSAEISSTTYTNYVTSCTTTTYTVTWSIDGHLTAQNYPIGSSYALTVPSGVATDATSYNCYERVFVGWTANSSWSSDNPPADLFRIPTGNVSANTTYYAVFAYEEGASWELVNNVSELSVGNKVVIAAASYNYAISTTQSGNNRAQAEITKSGSTITWSSSVCEFDLKAGTVSGTWAFYDATNTGYIYAASSSSNYLRTQATNDANGSWSISISSGTATITAQGTNTRNQLKYNNGDNIFSCYGSGQKAVAIYKKVSSYYGYSTSCIPCTDPTFSLPSASGIVNMGSTLSISLTNPNNTEVTWTSSNPSIATVSGTNTGATITGVNYGSATITASIRAANVSGTYYCPATVTYNVTVACATITLPVCFDFEDYASPNSAIDTDAGLPTCWNRIYSGSSSGYAPHVYNGTYAMDANGIVITSGSSSSYGTTNYVVMPFIDGLREDDIIRFNAWWESTSNGTLTFGFMTDPSNAATFSSIGTATAESYSGGSASTGQNEFTIPAAMPSGAYLAFQWSYSSSYYYSVVIDNICIEHACTTIPGTLTLNTTSGSIVAPATLDISGYVNNGINQTTYPGALSYVSSNDNVATVSAAGIITGVAEGSAVIIAKYTPDNTDLCARTAEFTVTVTDDCSKIGTGGSETFKVPLNNYYNFSYTQMLYRRTEVGLDAGIITSIGFQYAYSTPMSKKNYVDIYMVETNKESFSDGSDWVTAISGSNLVYSGPLNCSNGWNSFTLDEPFVYSDTKNLLVVIHDHSAEYHGQDYKFKYTATGFNSVISYYSDSYNYSNDDIEEVSANMTDYTYRPNTKFCIYGGTLHTVTYNTSANCTGGVAFSMPPTHGVEGYPTTISSDEPSCSDGIFLSWNTAQDGSGTTYAPGASIMLTEDITLYAQYTICDYVNIVKNTPLQGTNDGSMVDDEGNVVADNGVQKFNVCKGSEITLAVEEKDGIPANARPITYSWDVNRHDGNAHLTSSSGSISYTVENATGHDILLTVTANNGCHEQIPLRVFVSKGLVTHDDSPDIGNICVGRAKEITVGDPAVVSEPIIEVDNDQVEIKSTKGHAETTFIPDGVGDCYESRVTFADFKESTVITDASNIDYVRINMEHSHIGDMQISLICKTPAGQEKSVVILQDYYTFSATPPGLDDDTYEWYYKIIECKATYGKYGNAGSPGEWVSDGNKIGSVAMRTFVRYVDGTYSATGVRQEATAFEDGLSDNAALAHLRGMRNSGNTPAPFSDGEFYYVFEGWYQSADQYNTNNLATGDTYGNYEWSKHKVASLGFGKPNLHDWISNEHLGHSAYNPFGEGFDYCWSNNNDYSYGDDAGHEYVTDAQNHRVGDTNSMVVEQSDVDNHTRFYRPWQGFENLVGCKLNGDWKIQVCDTWENDNGYIFNWEIALKGVEDNSWKYTVSLDNTELGVCPGSGTSTDDLVYSNGGPDFYIHPTIANIASVPVTIGELRSCNLTLIDDLGCRSEDNGFTYTVTQPTILDLDPTVICLGEEAEFDATLHDASNNPVALEYIRWMHNGSTYPYSHDPITQLIVTPELASDVFGVEMYDAAGCGGILHKVVDIKVPEDVPTDYDYIWRGAANTDWNTAANWYIYNSGSGTYSVSSGTTLPTSSSNVYIGTSQCSDGNHNSGVWKGWPAQMSQVASVETSGKAQNLTVGSGASVTVASGKNLEVAQDIDNSGTITATGTIDVAGDLVNSGTFDGSTGTLNLAGDLNNTGTFTSNAGTVAFKGTLQTITNSGPLAFYNVNFDQSSAGTITAANGITVNGTATFKNGVVTGNALFNDGSSAIFDANARYHSYVDGTVTKKGNGAFTFPTGADGVLGTIATSIGTNTDAGVSVKFNHMRDEGASGTGQAGFGLDVYPNWWNQNYMCPEADGLPKLDHVSNFEYWQVDMDNLGASTSLSSITLKVDASNQLEHFNQDYSGREADKIFAAAHYDCWKNIGGTASLDNENQTITVGEILTLSRTRAGNFDGIITLGSTDHNTVLPIELTSFTATCNGKSALVEWTTASERNNDYFSLERSDDAINFTEVARIAGAGNSIEPIDYSYTDYGVRGGDNYYRLVQVDYDGSRTASEIVLANCVEASGEPEVVAYPNPFNGELTVELENFSNRPARIDVYDVLGRLVYTEDADAPQNSYQTVLHLGGLPEATYTVRVATNDFVINRKVVKQ